MDAAHLEILSRLLRNFIYIYKLLELHHNSNQNV